jgi:hypothetical protein
MVLAGFLAMLCLIFAEYTSNTDASDNSVIQNDIEVSGQNYYGFLNDSEDNLLGLDNEDLNTFFYKPVEHTIKNILFSRCTDNCVLVDLGNNQSVLLLESDLSPPHLS